MFDRLILYLIIDYDSIRINTLLFIIQLALTKAYINYIKSRSLMATIYNWLYLHALD